MTQFGSSRILALCLLVYLLFVLISQVVWWLKQAYFPNIDLCCGAHDRFHLSRQEKLNLKGDLQAVAAEHERFWHVMAARLMSQVPPELSIPGFFSAVAWPIFVLLNILLLAQVVGTQVGEGGGVWEIYPFGTYGSIALVTAILYAVAQTVAGIMYGESKDKKRYLALLFLALAILLEGGLAVYRSWLIKGGGTAAGVNLVDHSLASQFGLVVGAFFGIFFPATHAALGYVAFPRFLVPVVRYTFRFCGGCALLVWSAANYFLLAWHPVHPKDWIEVPQKEKALWDEQQRLMANANSLAGDLKLLLDDLLSTPATILRLVEQAKQLRAHWVAMAEEANRIVAQATSLTVKARAAVASNGSFTTTLARLEPLYQLASSHDQLVDAVEQIRKRENELDLDGKQQGEILLKRTETCLASLAKLQQRLEAIQAMAHQGMDADCLLSGCANSLNSLIEAFRTIPEPQPGHLRFPDYQKLRDLVKNCQSAYGRLQERWSEVKPVIPPADELRFQRDQLESIAKLTEIYSEASKSLFEAKEIASERLRRVECRPRWFYWLADWIT